MEDRKIPVKNLYLVLVICVGLVCLGIGSTYAVFTAEARIGSPISLSSNLTYNSNLMETVSVTVPAGKRVNSNLNITNSSGEKVTYAVFYIDKELDVSVGSVGFDPTGVLSDGESVTVKASVKNSGEEDTTVVIGVISTADTLILGSTMKVISSMTEASEYSYDNTNTGVECTDVQCMIDFLSK